MRTFEKRRQTDGGQFKGQKVLVQGGIHVISAPEVKVTLIFLAPAALVSPLVFLSTCAHIQRIRAVSAPAAPTKLPACAE